VVPSIPSKFLARFANSGMGLNGKDSVFFHYSALESWQDLLAYRELNALGLG